MAIIKITNKRDGSLSAGSPAGSVPSSVVSGGYVHNGFEGKTLQTETPLELLLDTPFWSAGGVTYDGKPYADYLALPNGTDNVWIQWAKIDGVCLVKQVASYGVDYVPADPATYHAKMVKWTKQETTGCGADAVPFP